MTRRHFELAAATVRAIPDAAIRAHHAAQLAATFAVINSRFDAARFYRACSVNK